MPAGFGSRRGGGSGGPGSFPGGGAGRRGGFFGGGGAGLSSAQQAAFAACRSNLPGGGRFGGRGFAGGASATQLKAYLSCLSDNGVKVPKTSTSAAGGSGPRSFISLRGVRSDPRFAAANKICRALLPARGSVSATPTTTG